MTLATMPAACRRVVLRRLCYGGWFGKQQGLLDPGLKFVTAAFIRGR